MKPVVEIMAALPSVVLGFLAGLWLAPMIERVVPGLFLLPLVAHRRASSPRSLLWRTRARRRSAAASARAPRSSCWSRWSCSAPGWPSRWAALVEARLLGGDYRGWLLTALGLTYDQRNSLVVGVAMGFAVIPIIFTIAEDSLANVPQHLRAGSLALGATRWQTALRIVLPTASPGIFSAIMIGFGRAVGETMIVLMATGNTPVMDWNIFNGFRALSANIAVELPEAPGGRHAVPGALPGRLPALLPDVRRQHRGRAGAPATAPEVPVPVTTRRSGAAASRSSGSPAARWRSRSSWWPG